MIKEEQRNSFKVGSNEKQHSRATLDDKFHCTLENLFLNMSIIWPSIVTICLLTRCFFFFSSSSLCTISHKNSGERTHWGRNIRGNPETFSLHARQIPRGVASQGSVPRPRGSRADAIPLEAQKRFPGSKPAT